MKKRSKFLAMLLSTAVAVSSLTGISVFAADKTSGEEETRTVVDATGAEVEVPAHPKRIAVPAMVLPNMVYALQGNAKCREYGIYSTGSIFRMGNVYFERSGSGTGRCRYYNGK